MLVHSVYFWLPEGMPQKDREEFRNGLNALKGIAAVETVYVGTPADTPDRRVIDRSYDFGLVVVLADRAAHDTYQADPLHQAFVTRFSNVWDRVLIYDVQ